MSGIFSPLFLDSSLPPSPSLHKIPIVLLGAEALVPGSKKLLMIARDLTLNQLGLKVKHDSKRKDSTIFFASARGILSPSQRLGPLFDRCKAEDGCLYLKVSSQEVFGSPGREF